MALFSRACTSKHSLNGLFNRLCKVSKYNNVQVAHITSRINRSRLPFPPIDYRKLECSTWNHVLFDLDRFDDNSRIIVVEGPIAAGKDKFCRELAKELDMGYMPPATFDRLFVDEFGNDIRLVHDKYPERLQLCDIPKFLTNPRHCNAQAFQVAQYALKLDDYAESLYHLLMTGQGVVLNRSAYSNFVFMKAMYNAGYMSRKCRRFYEKVVAQSISVLMRPHLVIYLDVPVNIVEERIKKRAIPYEVNSEVITTKFLTDIETIYKEEFLPKIENSSYLLMYDWSEEIDIQEVVEDIERMDLDYNFVTKKKFGDWNISSRRDLQGRRATYSHYLRAHLMTHALVTDYEVEEMFFFGKDVELLKEMFIKNQAKYRAGYSVDKPSKIAWLFFDEPYVNASKVITDMP